LALGFRVVDADRDMAIPVAMHIGFGAGASMRRQDPSRRRHLRMLKSLQPPAFNEKRGPSWQTEPPCSSARQPLLLSLC
jgi:hypothetical protein